MIPEKLSYESRLANKIGGSLLARCLSGFASPIYYLFTRRARIDAVEVDKAAAEYLAWREDFISRLMIGQVTIEEVLSLIKK